MEIRAGVCQDIAALYTKMGRMAGLDVNFVSGNVAPCTFDDLVTGLCRHAWNVVKIDGQWEYVDPTWAMDAPLVFTDVNSLRAYVRALEKRTKRDQNLKARKDRRINEKWWLTDKEEMIKTHLSDDEKWQLQKKKITLPEFIGIDKTAYKTRMRSRKRRETIKREVEQIRQTGSVSTGSF